MVVADTKVQYYYINTEKVGSVIIILVQIIISRSQINDGSQCQINVERMYQLRQNYHNLVEIVLHDNEQV